MGGEEEAVPDFSKLNKPELHELIRNGLAERGALQPAGWCPECGPRWSVDEDGCCADCGATATGDGANSARRSLIERRDAQIEAIRQTEYGVRQHEIAQDCIREARKWKAKAVQAKAEADVLRGTYCEEECEVDGERVKRNPCGVCTKCAFRRGAEAMREAALAACWHHGAMYLHKQIGALPVPEDKR
jgi:hypothetical protein